MGLLRITALYTAGAFAAGLLAVSAADAEPTHGIAMHGISMHGAPKYAADFAHLDYVNPDAPKGGVLRLAATGTFDTLNPNVIKGTRAAGLSLTTSTLMARVWDEPFSLYGLVADSIEVPDDRSWVTFTVREGARFSDGSPITVDDVIFSWETIRDRGRPNSRSTYSQIERAERIGSHGVKFVFKDGEDNRELPLLIAGFLPILSQAYWTTHDFEETTLEPPVSSGPYVIASVNPGRNIVYRRDPDYWGADLPVNVGLHNFDEIRYEYFRDSAIALESFKAGDLDYRPEGRPEWWATRYDFPAVRDGRVSLEQVNHGIASGLLALAPNLRKPLFADRRVRKALMLAFDFERINKDLLHGGFTRTNSLFDNSDLAPQGTPSEAELALLEPWRDQLPDEVFGEPFAAPVTDGSGSDRRPLRDATRLLREAGWQVADGKLRDADGEPFSFEILLNGQSNERIALAFARRLERLGIDATVRVVESAQYQEVLETFDFDMVFASWRVTLSPGDEQNSYWRGDNADAPGTRNLAGIADPAIDAMIDAVMAAEDRDALAAAVGAMDRILMWQHYVIPLYHTSVLNNATWNTVARPELVPVYGRVLETFWAVQ